MIVLDTHIWFWWVQGSTELEQADAETIKASENQGLLVSAISLLEVSRACTLGRMRLSLPVDQWLQMALSYPGIKPIPLSVDIVVDAYNLPEPFHKDPADRLIVATARTLKVPLLTRDTKIRDYPHVELAR